MGEQGECLYIFHKTKQRALCKTMKRSFAINFLHLMLDFFEIMYFIHYIARKSEQCYNYHRV